MTYFRTERLTSAHDLTKFDCDNPVMNGWLRNHAMRGQMQDTGRTFVWVQADPGHTFFEPNEVAAYFTLAAHQVHRSDIATAFSKTKIRGWPDTIPATLLARLALDQRLQGQGLFGPLLVSAMERCVAAGALAAAMLVVVDAIDDRALQLYMSRDFVHIPGTNRLVRPMRDVAYELSPESEE